MNEQKYTNNKTWGNEIQTVCLEAPNNMTF